MEQSWLRAQIRGSVRYPESKYGDPIVLLLPDDESVYYDIIIVKVPAGKTVRQVWTYRYETKNGFMKTVPIVRILDKNK